jgi:hypothetical protein
MADLDSDFDEQDQSEAFDEDISGDEGFGPSPEMRTFEEMPDVYDVTTALGDGGREDVALDEADFEDGALDDEDLEEDTYEAVDELVNGDDLDSTDDEDLDDLDGVTALASDEVELVYSDDIANRRGAQASAAHFESRGEIDQDEVDDLGYGENSDEEQEDR